MFSLETEMKTVLKGQCHLFLVSLWLAEERICMDVKIMVQFY